MSENVIEMQAPEILARVSEELQALRQKLQAEQERLDSRIRAWKTSSARSVPRVGPPSKRRRSIAAGGKNCMCSSTGPPRQKWKHGRKSTPRNTRSLRKNFWLFSMSYSKNHESGKQPSLQVGLVRGDQLGPKRSAPRPLFPVRCWRFVQESSDDHRGHSDGWTRIHSARDLRRLWCDAWLMPCDRRGQPNAKWLLNQNEFPWPTPPAGWGNEGLRVVEVTNSPDNSPTRWLVNVGGDEATPVNWFVDGAQQFLQQVCPKVKGCVARRDRFNSKRSKPLVALNLVGTGNGGGKKHAGEVVRASFRSCTRQPLSMMLIWLSSRSMVRHSPRRSRYVQASRSTKVGLTSTRPYANRRTDWPFLPRMGNSRFFSVPVSARPRASPRGRR